MDCGCDSGHDCGCHGHAASVRPNTMSHYPGGGRSLGVYRRLRGLGAMTPAAAAAQVTESKVTASGKAAILASANALQMMGASGEIAYVPGTADCAAAQGVPTGAQTDLKIGQSAAGLALNGVNFGLMATGTALGPVTAGISIAVSSIIGLFSVLVNHHAQAVKAEQTELCSAVPAANNYLNVIAQAVSSGLATPQDGINALESLKGDFRSAVGSIYNDCNAACVMYMELEAICLVMESQFQDMISAANATPAAAAPPTVITAGGPNVSSPGGVVAPASSYAPFYSQNTAPASTPNTVAAPTSSVPSFTTAAAPAVPISAGAPASTDWLPIAAVVLGAFFLLRGV